MYRTGTVTTTANSTKLVGTGTKWLNNINLVSAGQVIQIQIGNTVYDNSIQLVKSDTELTLNFPIPIAATNATYVILTTMIHSASDALNKMVALNTDNVQFSDILNRMMTESGVITVTLRDGTEIQLRTEKERDRLLDGKFDKAPALSVTNNDVLWKGQHAFTQVGIGEPGMGGKRAWITLSGLTMNPDGNGFYNVLWPEKSGRLMQVGNFGFGGTAIAVSVVDGYNGVSQTSVIKGSGVPGTPSGDIAWGSVLHLQRDPDRATQLGFWKGNIATRTQLAGKWDENWIFAYTTTNTTKDSNGNLKAASPIIKVFADHIELNEESEGVELEKLDTGRYKLKGVLGMNSDASWGGVHGGLVSPLGINGLELLWVDYKVLEDGDIIIETNYRKHSDLPPPVLLKRLVTYPEFMNDVGDELESYAPCDIPNGHWIDVRVNMPSNSIYNQKQAEAERLAKIEAERLAQEEAKRATEEAERAEQEAAEQAEQQ